MLSSTLRKLSSIVFCLLFATSVWAFDSSDAYNTITFSYRDNTFVSQQFVLSSTQKSSATSFTLTVDAKDGGGRPTHNLDGTCAAYCSQYDTAGIKINAYNSSGQLVGTKYVTQGLMNWGSSSNPGWSSGPGDNQHDWTQMSVTISGSDVGGNFSNVARLEVQLVNHNEGSYWAGNYGVQFRTPTLQADGTGSNLLYNSEFGVDSNGVKVQGWAPSYSAYSSCGVTSGSNICATEEQAVTANMWGGGEDPDGGTPASQPGGYESVLTSDNADTAAEGGDIGGGSAEPPAPTPVYSSGITAAQSAKRTSVLNSLLGHDAQISIEGNSNEVYIEQTGEAHYLELGVIGNSNYVDIQQVTTTIGVNHYAEVNLDGFNNSLDLIQSGSGEKTAFVGVDGSYNTTQIIQKDSGQHYLQLDLIGNDHDATIVQEGSGNHAATIELTNDGGAWDFTLNQSGLTDKEYSLPHTMSDGSTTSGTCYVAAGCSLTVVQSD